MNIIIQEFGIFDRILSIYQNIVCYKSMKSFLITRHILMRKLISISCISVQNVRKLCINLSKSGQYGIFSKYLALLYILKKVYLKPIGMILLKFIIESGEIYKIIIFSNTATVDTARDIFSILLVFREYSPSPVFLSYDFNHLLDMEF